MNMPNLGYLYFKDYYVDYFKDYNKYEKINNKGEIQKYFKDKHNKLFNGIEKFVEIEKSGNKFLYFKTTYPGVLIGSGLIHSIGVECESKLGFQFDYTTGLPVINGSSVKGVIRKIFDLVDEKDEAIEYLKDIILNNDIFKDRLKDYELKKYKGNKLDCEYFKKLRNEMFEGIREEKNQPMYKRDIFYEAVIDIEKTSKVNNEESIPILGEDYITPHKNPLKNPTPIKFIKLMPNIIIRFQFDLKDGILTKNEKLYLFSQIILDFGIGAKTNIGYGRFDDKYTVNELKSVEKHT
ncbi:type III-B CRISPR module RAMP protein Cmr6 [Clostridium botulinum]|uniref:type III-B CRISPR module RAMP protein Cmr6 n=1 Tax=Clostridium botulinum TaxID=1491 RepID=UPI000691EE1A|nr:type III-B CRISPR module RAMP protein Cmr6 [Clostridium botulinum]MCD3234877.1 type III-B CRISPR module RAMP protein Cmr6 [Clostridium botulinum D/C]MCD3240776.1 type III-B CRISPR module RAMP protein Cmr6 [Clostridium botulinum D/C]MCD3268278.1 type III-B CRISPR module RAMP protein Cmr6 [Clostridium botulinum D/C]MCD3300135.1 type III-B CRISPR module RAMP protein Cmr6 [Clostridium botulinum D/C]MCD3306653.1 type III-B CRISPR module RAMP protein Cmr6 [Clostridium botulinum D/C]